MKNLFIILFPLSLLLWACGDDNDQCKTTCAAGQVQLEDCSCMADGLESYSKTPNFITKMSGFNSVEIFPILSSEDVLTASPNFVYGSMADGAGLIRNDDGTYTFINNIEADYSVARVQLDQNLKPISGEYILNANATAGIAQCSGTLATQEEHGFGPLFLSGGEWDGTGGGGAQGVFAVDPTRSAAEASTPNLLDASMGQWAVENAVPLGKDAYPNQTVVLIGDDDSNNEIPEGHLGMYVGPRGDLTSGKLYGLKVSDVSITYEVDMKEGTSYPVEFVEVQEREKDLLNTEMMQKGIMGFSRLEDIDWRRGSASNQREVYFCVTGRKKDGLVGRGTIYGRIYKLVMNSDDPTGAGTIILAKLS